MSSAEPEVTIYLNEFRVALRRYRVPNSAEISADLSNHIAEAASSGKPIADVLRALGSPDELARAYAIELLVSPPEHSRIPDVFRVLKILSVVVGGGFLSLFIVVTLGLVGSALILGGSAMIVSAIFQQMGKHPWWFNLGPLSPETVALPGTLLFVVGAGALWLLWVYVRITARTARKLLPHLN